MPTNPNDLVTDAITTAANGNIVFASEYSPKSLTKREYFAVMALQGILSDAMNLRKGAGTCSLDEVAVISVKQADELIKALNE